MNIFKSKFRFSSTEHPYYSTIAKLAIYKGWSKDLLWETFLFFVRPITGMMFFYYIILKCEFIIDVNLLSMDIPKRTTLSLEKIYGQNKCDLNFALILETVFSVYDHKLNFWGVSF